MFPIHRGTMDETGRHFARFDVVDEGSSHEDQRLRIDETNAERTDATALHHPHHPTRKRELPQKLRVPEESAVESRTLGRGGGGGRSTRGRRRTTSLSSFYTNETPEERNARLTYMRERRRQRMQTETEEQRAARLVESRERARQKLLAETHEEREKRLKYLRDRQRQRIKSETKEERERRLLYLRERQKERLRSETLEERQKRLGRSRQHGKRVVSTSTSTDPPEQELNVDIREDVMYIRDSQCQVILTEPRPASERDPLDLRDYQNRQQQSQEERRRRENAALTIGRMWSLKPNTGIDDRLWYHNQL